MRIRPLFGKQQHDKIAELLGWADAPPQTVQVFLSFCAADNNNFNGKKFQGAVAEKRPAESAWKWLKPHYKDATAEHRDDDRLDGQILKAKMNAGRRPGRRT